MADIYNTSTTTSGLADILKAVQAFRDLPLVEPLPRVEPSLAVPKHSIEWEFPLNRFVEYEDSDKRWAIPLGFGRWVDSLVAYKVDWSTFSLGFGFNELAPDPVIYAHPDTVKEMRTQVEKRFNERIAREIFGPRHGEQGVSCCHEP